MDISREEKKYLFSIAHTAIQAHFSGARFNPENAPEKFREKMGVFVTLKEKGELRGCIGYPLPVESVAQSIADNAVNAAFQDPRFPPLAKDEFQDLEIEITLLTVPEEVKFKTPEELVKKIKLGRDGLILEYGPYTGLFLPQVPVEEKWDVKTYLSYLCMKAGLDPNTWLSRPIGIKAFQGIILREEKK